MNFNIVKLSDLIDKKRMDSEYFYAELINEEKSIKEGKLFEDYFKVLGDKFDKNKYDKDTFNYLEISGIDVYSGNYVTDIHKTDLAPSRATKLAKLGAVVVSSVRPYRSGVAIIQKECVCSSGFILFEPTGDISKEELFLYLKSDLFKRQISRRTRATMYPAVDEIDFKDLVLPNLDYSFSQEIKTKIPNIYSLEEKKLKIEDETKEAVNLFLTNYFKGLDIDSIKNLSISKIDISTLFQDKENRIDSEFYHKFYLSMEELFLKSGNFFYLKDYFQTIFKGNTPSKKEQTESNYGYSIIKANALSDAGLNFFKREPITEDFYKKSISKLTQHLDILILSDAHSQDHIGKKINIITEDESLLESVITSGELITIRGGKLSNGLILYLYFFLGSRYGYLSIQRQVRGITSHLYPNDVLEIKIPEPDKQLLSTIEQNFKIINKLDKEKKQILKKLLDKYDEFI
ncbi:MAG: hypothetical protein CMD89_03855 [Gammaproteobacteria bacterium]|nr:hypothetical protein [Gammaproteobacteria bacterium]|tara:strand:+ start:9392 stop:10771 length:1380 start_codon:yes stop_codon:yes gene_type:complete